MKSAAPYPWLPALRDRVQPTPAQPKMRCNMWTAVRLPGPWPATTLPARWFTCQLDDSIPDGIVEIDDRWVSLDDVRAAVERL